MLKPTFGTRGTPKKEASLIGTQNTLNSKMLLLSMISSKRTAF